MVGSPVTQCAEVEYEPLPPDSDSDIEPIESPAKFGVNGVKVPAGEPPVFGTAANMPTQGDVNAMLSGMSSMAIGDSTPSYIN